MLVGRDGALVLLDFGLTKALPRATRLAIARLLVAACDGDAAGSLAALRSLYAGFTTNLSLKLPYMAFAFGLNASSAGTPSRRFMTRHGRVDRQAIGSQQPRPLGLRW